jgi:hypothetical protein
LKIITNKKAGEGSNMAQEGTRGRAQTWLKKAEEDMRKIRGQ